MPEPENFLEFILTAGPDQKSWTPRIDELITHSTQCAANGDFAGAINNIKQALRERPCRGDPMVIALYGCILALAGDTDQSNRQLSRSAALLPTLAVAYTTFGAAMLRLRRYDEAEQLAHKALLEDPPDPEGLNLLVRIHHAARREHISHLDAEPHQQQPRTSADAALDPVLAGVSSEEDTETSVDDCSQEALLTIVLPSYNYARFITKAVQSVIDQTSPHWRLMIFDNRSTDNTLDVLQPFLADPRIQLVLREENIGAKPNLVRGMQAVNSEFVSVLQADDYLEDTFVEVAIRQFRQHPKAPFVFFNWQHLMNDTGQFLDHNRHPFSPKRVGPVRIGPYLTVCNFVPFHVAAFRTQCLKEYFDFYTDSPLNQVGEQLLLKILEDAYGCGCYSGTMGGYWRRHDQQITAQHIATSVDAIEEPVERHWYAMKAPNPNYVNVFLALVGFAQLSGHVSYKAALTWLLNKGACYAEHFNVPIAQEREHLESVALTVALKYTVYTQLIKLIDEATLKEWLIQMGSQPTFEGLKSRLEIVRQKESDTFINSEEIREICSAFFGEESSYTAWKVRHDWSGERCLRIKTHADIMSQAPAIHILLTLNHVDIPPDIINEFINKSIADTIDDLTAQALSNWRLTVFSQHICPDRFASSGMLEWVETPTQQIEAIAATVEASLAEWFFCAPIGLRLSPAFTLLTSLYLSKRPNTLLLYADEDIIDSDGDGGYLEPRLKPDINIELLRSKPYVGAAVLVRKPLMLDPRISILPAGLTRNYGATLLAVERGAKTVGHLDEILVHIPEILTEEYANTALVQVLVQQHLTRCGVFAEIANGSLPGTLFIDYKLPAEPPKVSIIVASTHDRPDDIRSCLESLLEKTDYPNFEILLVACGYIEPDVQAFFSEPSNRSSCVRILRYSRKYSCAAVRNFAAQQAQGEFLLLLSDDTLILQENWLVRLVAIGTCKDVGVVGCRLSSLDQKVKNAGLILGLGGAVGSIGIDVPLTEPGYMSRAQLTQDFSAVSAACMLVRKSLFSDINGFDEKSFSNFYYDVDLCIRLGEHGYRIVWTPFVTVARQDNNGSDAKPNYPEGSFDSQERKTFIRKWFSRLGNDPAYNRHLSLHRHEWMIDGDFNVPWHPDFEPLPRIVAQPPDEMGVGHYRMLGPVKELTSSGRISSFLLPPLVSGKSFLPLLSEFSRVKADTLFLQNAFSHPQINDLETYAELLPNVFRVFGQDDIVFSIPSKSSVRKHFGKDTKARVRKAVSLCHRAIVTTEPIAEALRGMVDDIRVMPNYLERSRWGDLQPPRNERRKLRLGWAGAQQHQGDLEFILPVVEATANEVDWIFMGLCPPKLRYHVAEVHNAVNFDQYPAGLAALDLDLAIAPLEINRFNAAKSNLRLLEYGAVSYPVICTDIEPYRNAPVTRVPNNPQIWIDTIRAHIYDMDATRAAGEQLHEWVLSSWMLDQHLDEWLKMLLPD